jgi:hypothetical protein
MIFNSEISCQAMIIIISLSFLLMVSHSFSFGGPLAVCTLGSYVFFYFKNN